MNYIEDTCSKKSEDCLSEMVSQQASLQSMAELDEISRMQSHFSPHFLLIILLYLMHALAILCKLANIVADIPFLDRTSRKDLQKFDNFSYVLAAFINFARAYSSFSTCCLQMEFLFHNFSSYIIKCDLNVAFGSASMQMKQESSH